MKREGQGGRGAEERAASREPQSECGMRPSSRAQAEGIAECGMNKRAGKPRGEELEPRGGGVRRGGRKNQVKGDREFGCWVVSTMIGSRNRQSVEGRGRWGR